jgi:hypothetical protein
MTDKNTDISNTLTSIANDLSGRPALVASEAAALHAIRLAARLLYRVREMHPDWHDMFHEFFAAVEIREGNNEKNRYVETSINGACDTLDNGLPQPLLDAMDALPKDEVTDIYVGIALGMTPTRVLENEGWSRKLSSATLDWLRQYIAYHTENKTSRFNNGEI